MGRELSGFAGTRAAGSCREGPAARDAIILRAGEGGIKQEAGVASGIGDGGSRAGFHEPHVIDNIFMRAFVATVDHSGLRRLVPEEAALLDLPDLAARSGYARRTTVVWALLDPGDAEAIRAEVGAGRHRDACGLLLNTAVELLPLAAANPEFARSRSAED